MASKSKKQKLPPLLFFGEGAVEWIPSPGAEDNGYRRDETLSRSPLDMVRVARGLAKESKVKPGACTVLLGGDQVKQRVFTVGAIPPKEIKGVLRRKAANLLEVEEHQVVFSAIPLATDDGEGDHRWLVSASRLDEMRTLQRQLIKDGFQPKRFLIARQAMLRTAESFLSTGTDDESWVIVGVEDKGVAISLVAAGQLVQQSFVPGEFDASSAMAASVIQEMRGFEAYWRRFSRGGAIDDVFVAGLTESDAEQFELACHAALPNSDFLAMRVGASEGPEEARASYLSTCAAGAGVEGDMTLPRPIGKRWLVTTAAITLSLGIFAGRYLRTHLHERVSASQVRTEGYAASVPNLLTVEADLEKLQTRLRELEVRKEIAESVGTAGISLRPWMTLAEDAFRGRAVLESLHLDDKGGELSFSAGGRITEDPTRSTIDLAIISKALTDAPNLGSFRMRLPTTVNGTTTGQRGMEFSVSGAILGGAPHQ